LARLALEAPVPGPPWPEEVLRSFLRLLADAPASTHAIETLDQFGVWERYMPEWPRVRNRPQFDPYHRFTVDRHLLETVANAATRARDVHRPDLLLLGALLHDVGKGAGEDHSRAGAAATALAAQRFGLTPRDAAAVEKLVLVVSPQAVVRSSLRRMLVPLDRALISATALESILHSAASAHVEVVVAHIQQEETLPAFGDHLAHEVKAWTEAFVARRKAEGGFKTDF
jgi:[protein-PII] uridylyltransferase